jgi:integrase/recombinase XerD
MAEKEENLSMMNAKPEEWSEEKQHRLQECLVGKWAADTWDVVGMSPSSKGKKQYLRFSLTSAAIKTELKYAAWYKFDSGAWRIGRDQRTLCTEFSMLVAWLNMVAADIPSLMIHSLEYWETSLRSYLISIGLYWRPKQKRLRANQHYQEYETEDKRICLFRQLYKIITAGYDTRAETDKDIWDMRKLGVAVQLTGTHFYLNFTAIEQPWLRQLAKDYLKYNLAIRSPGDSAMKLGAIRDFSRFLSDHAPGAQMADIDRSLIVTYLHALQVQKKTVHRRNQLLIQLRMFFEVCAHRLQVPNLTKDRLIFEEDIAKEPKGLSREIPEEVQVQLRTHLDSLPTTTLRMVTILLECGLRIGELCALPSDCLICDDRHEWYLRFYQPKLSQEHIIPLIEEKVVGAIQAQQQEICAQLGRDCPYLFPNPRFSHRPYKETAFAWAINKWAVAKDIRDRNGKLWRFRSHQFRHTVSMRLINEDVPLEVISRLLGHRSLTMTQVYARIKDKKMRADLERAARTRKTVDFQGKEVKGDQRANDPEVQMTRKGVRGQTLPVGGCGRLVVLGECSHANKCLTCPMWLTSTDDLLKLKSFYERAVRLKQRAEEKGNHFVVEQQEHIIASLAIRIKSLEATEMDGTLAVADVLGQLKADLAEAESALEEIHENGLIPAAKYLERTITDLKARIAALEESV